MVTDAPSRMIWPQDGPNDQFAEPGNAPPVRLTVMVPPVRRQQPWLRTSPCRVMVAVVAVLLLNRGRTVELVRLGAGEGERVVADERQIGLLRSEELSMISVHRST